MANENIPLAQTLNFLRQQGKFIMDGGDGCEKELAYSLYINPNFLENEDVREVPIARLEEAIRQTNPSGPWKVSKTGCGLIAGFTFESDSLALLNSNLAENLGCPVQVARFSTRELYKQTLILRDIPWAVPIQEVKLALERQGLHPTSIDRIRQNIKIEVTDPLEYDTLLRQGLDFFGVTRFSVLPDRWRTNINTRQPDERQDILQCYRCQGFWHIAANCPGCVRCVRCGEAHSVDVCPRPRSEPTCCHCAGPHHAAFRQCPVRLSMLGITPLQLTFATSKTFPRFIPRPPFTKH